MANYRKRQSFSSAETELILTAYKTRSAADIADEINRTNPTRSVPVTNQQVYSVLRTAKRHGENKVSKLLANEQIQEAAEYKQKILSAFPNKKESNSALMNNMLDKLLIEDLENG